MGNLSVKHRKRSTNRWFNSGQQDRQTKILLENIRKSSEGNQSLWSRRSPRMSLRDKMDNGSSENLTLQLRDKQLVSESWKKLSDRSNGYLRGVLTKAWLTAAERCPIWIWGLIGVEEGNQEQARSNKQFQHIIKSVHEFLHQIIIKHSLDMDYVKQSSHDLGIKHRNYMDLGHQKVYWDCFWIAITDAVIQAIQELLADNKTFGKKSKLREHGLPCTMEAWKKFVRILIEEMRRGYTGEVAHIRLSLTSSILTLSSRRHSSRGSAASPHSLNVNYFASRSSSIASGSRGSWHLQPPGINPRRSSSPRPSLAPSIDMNLATYIPDKSETSTTKKERPPPLKKVVSATSLGFYAARMRQRHPSERSTSSYNALQNTNCPPETCD